MFGLQNFGIWSVYLLCILSTAVCIVYGIINWNKGGNADEAQIKKAAELQKEESDIEENL